MARVSFRGVSSKKEKGRDGKKGNIAVVSWAEERQGLPDQWLLQGFRWPLSMDLSHRDCVLLLRTCSAIPVLTPA